MTDVLTVQKALKAHGFDPGPLDGADGPKTQAAVRAYQAARGLVVDGVAGAQTLRALGLPDVAPASGVPQAIIDAARASQRRWGVPASVSIAQFGIESAWGTKMPAGSNNPFGIKAVAGQAFSPAMTREVIGGVSRMMVQNFAKYPSFTEAFDAHGRLLATSPYYAKARRHIADPDAYANALTGIYATDPHYGTVLIGVMKARHLYRYNEDGQGRSAA